jgi:hypothetical protein
MIPARETLVSDIPARLGTGISKSFFTVDPFKVEEEGNTVLMTLSL